MILGLPIPVLVAWILEVVRRHREHLVFQASDRAVIYRVPLTGTRRVVGTLKEIKYRDRFIAVPPHEVALTDTLHRAVGIAPVSVCVAMAELAFQKSARVLRAEWCAPHVIALLDSGYRSPDELYLALRTSRLPRPLPQMIAVLAALEALGRYKQQRGVFLIELIFSRGRRLSLCNSMGMSIWRREDDRQFTTPDDPEEHVRDHCPWYVRYDKLGEECLLVFAERRR